eukprot:1161833-Pelagomonas_calceolata.AAC.9
MSCSRRPAMKPSTSVQRECDVGDTEDQPWLLELASCSCDQKRRRQLKAMQDEEVIQAWTS